MMETIAYAEEPSTPEIELAPEIQPALPAEPAAVTEVTPAPESATTLGEPAAAAERETEVV